MLSLCQNFGDQGCTAKVLRAQPITSGINSQCHDANSRAKYKLYFNHLHSKMLQYEIQLHNTCNMNEKGFMIRITMRLKLVFSQRQ
jgi:hypothetical protein